MTESMTVQTTLTAKDDLSPVLEKVMKVATDLHKSLQNFGSLKVFDTMTKGVDKVAASLGTAMGAADKFGASLGAVGGSASANLMGNLAKEVGGVSRAFTKAAGSADRFEQSVVAVSGKAGSLAPVVSQVQQLAAAAQQAASGQKSLNTALGATPAAAGQKQQGRHGGKWGALGMDMLVAGEMIEGMGDETFDFLKSIYEVGAEYQQTFAAFKALNLGDAINADADKFASGTQLFGVTANELMATLNGLHQTMNDYGKAKALAPFVAEMEFANQAVFKGKINFDEVQRNAMGKVIEIRGGFKSDEEMRAQADYMQRVMSGTSGQVMPQQYLQFLKRGGIAATLMGNREFYFQMEPMIQELGGSTAGTGLNSAYQNLAQGRTTKKVAGELARLGLLDPKTMGRGMLPHAVQGGDMVGTDPLRFLTEVLLPAFRAKGITSDKDIINEIGTIFSNRTAAGLYTKIFQQREKIEKNMSIDEHAMGVEGVENLAKNTPEGVMRGFMASWGRFAKVISEAFVGKEGQIGVVSKALMFLSSALDKMTTWAQAHPIIVKFIMAFVTGFAIVAAILGGLLVFAGTIALIAVSFGALIGALGAGAVAGIVAFIALIAGVVTAIIFVDWDWLAGVVGDFFVGLWQTIKEGAARAWQAVSAFFSSLWSKIVAGWHSAVNWLTTGLSAFWDAMEMLPHIIAQATINLGKKIVEFGSQLWDGFKTMLTNLINSIVAFLKGALLSAEGALGLAPSVPSAETQRKAAEAIAKGLPPGRPSVGDAHRYLSGPTIQGNPSPAAAGGLGPTAARAAAMNGQDGVAAQPGAPIQIQSTGGDIHLDGEKVGAWAVKFMANQSGGPNTGPASHDPLGSYTPPGVAILGSAY